MGWFKKFISFLADGFAKFMDIFASVSEAVVEFAIAPVLTLLIGLFSALTTALCEIMGLLGTSIPSMFLMDIGTGQSFFEITVGGLDVWIRRRLRDPVHFVLCAAELKRREETMRYVWPLL